jgi:hypothetical protein
VYVPLSSLETWMSQPPPTAEQVQTNVLQTKCTKGLQRVYQDFIKDHNLSPLPHHLLLTMSHLNQDPGPSHGPREKTV